MKKRFLVVYDYGMGGVWALIMARSKEEILEKYPDLTIVDERPSWMSDDYFERLTTKTYDIDDEPEGWLSKL